MSKKSSPESAISIFDEIPKYLNYQLFTKSLSTKTGAAYALDLQQAFQLEKRGRLECSGTPTEKVFHYHWIPHPKKANNSDPVVSDFPMSDTFSEADLLELAKSALKNWSELAASSRNRKVASLKGLFGWLFEQQKIGRDLSLHLHSPKVPVRIPHFISVDEVLAVLSTLKNAKAKAVSDLERRQSLAMRPWCFYYMVPASG